MSQFVRRYGRYLNSKAASYRTVAYDFTRKRNGDSTQSFKRFLIKKSHIFEKLRNIILIQVCQRMLYLKLCQFYKNKSTHLLSSTQIQTNSLTELLIPRLSFSLKILSDSLPVIMMVNMFL